MDNRPELFVSGKSRAELKGDLMHLAIPTGESSVRLVLTRHAAMILTARLTTAMPLYDAVPNGEVIPLPKRSKGGRKHA